MRDLEGFDPAEVGREVEIRKASIRKHIERLQEQRESLELALEDDDGLTEVVLGTFRERERIAGGVKKATRIDLRRDEPKP